MRWLIAASATLLWSIPAETAEAPRTTLPKPLAELLGPAHDNCPGLTSRQVDWAGQPIAPRKLTELPPAKAYHSVIRQGPDGCLDPLLVGYQNHSRP